MLLGMECAKEVSGIIEACLEKGLLLINAGPNVLRFIPPLNITFEQVDRAAVILEEALAAS